MGRRDVAPGVHECYISRASPFTVMNPFYYENNPKVFGMVILVFCSIFSACRPEGSANVNGSNNVPVPTLSPVPAPSVFPSPSASLVRSEGEKEGKYMDYHYYYKIEGDTTVALFAKRYLPRDDTIVVGAIRDVIQRAYQDRTSGAPYLVETGTSGKAIRIDGAKYGYVVLPIKEDTGEVHSLTIRRVAR